MSRSINLITCMKFFKALINNATEFAQNSTKTHEHQKSLDDLKTIRTNFCQVLWMKSILTDLLERVDTALEVYNTTIEPIINNISDLVDDDGKQISKSSLYNMWQLSYHNSLEPPNEIMNSWADMTEYDDICCHIKAMKEVGYPEKDNIQPIKELKSPSNSALESSFNLHSVPKETKYYEYEISGRKITLPIVENLEDVPSCFYYFKGSKKYSRGVYMSPYDGVVMQVPAVRVIPYSMENANYFSMKCVQGKNCKNIRCTYAHPGTDYIKIGCVSRCPTAHSFGNKETLSKDLDQVNIEDIRIVSMYGLNDIFSSALWFSQKLNSTDRNDTRILNNLEVCDDYTNQKFIESIMPTNF